MNSITYNGILLDGVSVRTVNRQAILNGPDYLYTDYEIHVRGVYNEKYTLENPQNEAPPAYDSLIRHKLMQPRRAFNFTLGGADWVDLADTSPGRVNILTGQVEGRSGVVQDAQLGCFPVYANVMQVIGSKTWMVDFGFKLSLNECTGSGKLTASALLSNRWDASQVVDNQSFSRINVAGRAVFRPDVLAKLQLTADQLRRWLFLPVPKSYRRESLSTAVSQDGAAIRYSFTDKQLAFGIPYPGIADIEIYQSMAVGNMGMEALLTRAAPSWARSGLSAADQLASAKTNPFGAVSGVIGFLEASRDLAAAAIPKTTNTVRMVVYGTYDCDMSALFQAAILVLNAKLPPRGRWLHGTQARVEANLHRKILVFDYAVESAPLTMAAAAVFTGMTEQVGQTMTWGQAAKGAILSAGLNSILPGAGSVLPAVQLMSTKSAQTLNQDSAKSLEAQMAGKLDATTNNIPITFNGVPSLLIAAKADDYSKTLSPDKDYAASPVSLLTAALLGPCDMPQQGSALTYPNVGPGTTAPDGSVPKGN